MARVETRTAWMSYQALWAELMDKLSRLASPDSVYYNRRTRQMHAARCLAIAQELKSRGVQLDLFGEAGDRAIRCPGTLPRASSR